MSSQDCDVDEGRLLAAVELLTARSLNGEQFTEEMLQAEFPGLTDQLIQLLPTINTMLKWGQTIPVDAEVASSAELQINQPVGDFRIIRELGRGGMGIVYEAEQMSLRRRVALKVLPFAALLDPRQLDRFKNEVRAAAMLKHANVVSVHAVGCERGVHFYAMELIDGCSLTDLIESVARATKSKSRQIQTDGSGRKSGGDETPTIARISTQYSTNRRVFYNTIARIGIEASWALEFAHGEGVIHRDVKPSNLLIDGQGVVHIVDFGLALIENSTKMTLTGDIVGTLRYMSPEQLESSSVVDVRSDVYSLGATLYEVLCGQPARMGENRAELMRSIGEEPIDLRKIDSAIPVDLATIVMKCLSNRPAERYPSAGELADDLVRFREDRPIVARRTSRLESIRRKMERNRVVSVLTALTITLLFALAFSNAMRIARLASAAKEREVQLYGQAIRLAHEAVQRGDFVDAESTLLDLVPAQGAQDHRGFEWSYLWNASHDPAIERTFVHSFTVYDTEFIDPDRLAVSWWSNRVPIWDLTARSQSAPRTALAAAQVVELHYISSDNRIITVGRNATVREWDAETGQSLTSTQMQSLEHGSTVASIAVDETNSFIAIGLGGATKGDVAVWNRNEQSWIFRSSQFENKCLAEFGHDGLLYVAEQGSRKVTSFDIQSGQAIGQYDIGISGVRHLSSKPGREQFVVVANPHRGESKNGMVALWNVKNKQLTTTAALGTDLAVESTVSKDGSMVAVGDRSGMIYLLDGTSLDLIKARKAHFGIVSGLSFSHDGKRLATASSDNQARVWNVNQMVRDVSRVTLSEDLGFCLGAAFVDDSTTVLSDQCGQLVFSDARDGKHIQTMQLPYDDTNMHQLALSHSRRLIAATHGRHPRSKLPSGLYLVDAAARSVLWRAEVEPGIVYSVSSFSPDDSLLAVSAADYVVIFDVRSGEVIKRLHDGEAPGEHPYFKPATFSPDGRWLACGSTAGKLHVFSLPNFRREHVINVIGVCEDVQFSPDSQTIALLDFDKRIKLFSPLTGERIHQDFARSPGFVSFLRFSPDGKRILTGGLDGKIRIWHTELGEQLLVLDTPPGDFSIGDFSRNGNAILTAGGTNAYVFWGADDHLTQLEKAELEEIACSTQSGSARRRLKKASN